MKYQILQCSSVAILQERVNQLLRQGWICQGGYSSISSWGGGVQHCQAMVFTSAISDNSNTSRPSSGYSSSFGDSGLVSVVLVSIDPVKKIGVIREVRSMVPGLGLAEAKNLVESTPQRVKEGITRMEAESIKMQLEAVGAQVRIE